MRTLLGRTGLVVWVALSGALASPAAFSATFAGKINGHDCAHEGKTCPTSRLDPHVAIERDFVLQKANGDYMFMPNIPRSVKVRHVLDDVEVTGDLDTKYQSIEVDELRVGGKVVWSQAQQRAEFEKLHSEGQIPGFFAK